jgi:signal peptidase I
MATPRTTGAKRRKNRWYVYVAAMVLLTATLMSSRAFVQTFHLPTGSMEPTLLRGDYLLSDNRAYVVTPPWSDRPWFRRGTPKRGDVVTYRYPEERSRLFMHRVIGLPGEAVHIKGRKVEVNGTALDEPYTQFLRDDDEEDVLGTWGPEVVPAGHVFTLGDNRDNAKDSRFFGFVPLDDVLGRVFLVYWSREIPRDEGSALGAIRWNRIGHRPR